MTTLKDLIKKGIAKPVHTQDTIGSQTTSHDPVVKTYNNIWGVASNTHMSLMDDGRYVITGSLVADRMQFEYFLCARKWGGLDFTNSSIHLNSLVAFLTKNALIGHFETINNDATYVCVKSEGMSLGSGDCCVQKELCADCACGCCEGLVRKTACPDNITEAIRNNSRDVFGLIHSLQQIDENWVGTYGDDKFILLNGSQHIEVGLQDIQESKEWDPTKDAHKKAWNELVAWFIKNRRILNADEMNDLVKTACQDIENKTFMTLD